MAYSDPKPIGELIDRLDRIREEMLTMQRSLEKLESIETLAAPDDEELANTK